MAEKIKQPNKVIRILRAVKNATIGRIGRFLNRLKISQKLTIVYSFMIFSILVLFVLGSVIAVFLNINLQNKKTINNAADIAASIIEEKGVASIDLDSLGIESSLWVVIYSDQFEIIKQSDSVSPKVLNKLSLNIFNKVLDEDEHDSVMYLNRQVDLGGAIYIVQIIKPLTSELSLLRTMGLTLGMLLIAGVGLSILVGYCLNRQLLKPISKMTHNANEIQRNGVSNERLKLSGKEDEINALGKTINSMLDRMEDYANRQTQFVSDASHELRTPLTVILSYAEMLKRWAKDDKETFEKSINYIESEALNMTALVENLLTLAKSDANQLKVNAEQFKLESLILELFEETKLIAGDRKVELVANHNLNITSDKAKLKELLRILLDNAIKYTNKNGRIILSSVVENSELTITVEDNGIGIKQEDLESIFNRFYCAESSRNKKKSGSGLGLSIAKALSQAMGFSLSAESKEGQYTKFILIKLI